MIYCLLIVLACERLACQKLYLFRGKTIAYKGVQEEIVQLVRTNQILSLLSDVTLFVGRQQLGTDRGCHYIAQCSCNSLILRL